MVSFSRKEAPNHPLLIMISVGNLNTATTAKSYCNYAFLLGFSRAVTSFLRGLILKYHCNYHCKYFFNARLVTASLQHHCNLAFAVGTATLQPDTHPWGVCIPVCSLRCECLWVVQWKNLTRNPGPERTPQPKPPTQPNASSPLADAFEPDAWHTEPFWLWRDSKFSARSPQD